MENRDKSDSAPDKTDICEECGEPGATDMLLFPHGRCLGHMFHEECVPDDRDAAYI